MGRMYLAHPASFNPVAAGLKLSELVAGLSHALDLAEGQPQGHGVRCCWIGMQLAREIGLDEEQRWELYYTLLLKDLGGSSNAARICELYLTDDLQFKHDFKQLGDSLGQAARFVLRHTGLKAGVAERLHSVLHIVREGRAIAQELIQTRCQRGADIARQLRFPEAVATAIYSLDEHWNGGGRPEQLAGAAIPLYARIALLAQVIDVLHTAGGRQAALREIGARSGQWFDPELVRAFEAIAAAEAFWATLAASDLERAVLALAPGHHAMVLDEDYLDDIAAAFGQVVDAKSPYTGGHSARVALYTDRIGAALDFSPERRRWLRRGALLHDLGKLGVSNSVLDKTGPLDAAEWKAAQQHAALTEAILSRIAAFGELARVAGAHHERLDGSGYPRGLKAADIGLETRIITTADIFDAMTAPRPYRDAIPIPQALEMMGRTMDLALDPDCCAALRRAVAQAPAL